MIRPTQLSVLFPILCGLASGCGGTTAGNPTITTSASEIAEGALSGGVNSTEPGGSSGASYRLPVQSKMQEVARFLSPVSVSYAANSCPTFVGSTCTSGAMTLAYSSCTFAGSSALWSGTQTLTFAGGAGGGGCPATPFLTNMNGVTLGRTFGGGTSETTVAGEKTVLDTITAADSGYSIKGLGEGEQAVWGAGSSRSFEILGLHLTGSGVETYDHTISSTALAVTGFGANRALSGGTITVQHNLAKYTATVSISSLSWGLAGCCHPTSGTFTTTYSGSAAGQETLTFSNSSCGAATLVSTAGVTSAIALGHCF